MVRWVIILPIVPQGQKTELVSAISSCPSPSQVILKGTLFWAPGTLLLTLLVHSSVDNSFIDEKLARQAGLLSQKVVLDLDGCALTKVIHRTACSSGTVTAAGD